MKTLLVAPDPGLLESMRSIGYTVEAAVADIVDNAVAAEAQRVEIVVSAAGPFQIAVLDDGTGMSHEEAVDAMRLAATSPSQVRRPDDLGRFGLGLKTASLSQCRTLTLVTKKGGTLTALRWSLDHVIQSGDWSLIELDADELNSLVGWQALNGRSSGTLVHWGDMDLLAMSEGRQQVDLDRVAQRVRSHLALVFHLFIAGDGARRVELLMNGALIEAIDPFMAHSKLTSKTAWESIHVDGEAVRLMAYTLPYLERLSSAERTRALALGTLRETQGFYIYRGCRLVIWGSWFRVMPRSEMAKLTRVRVEIPNSLDHLWALDVKKSQATPPPLIRRRLSELAATMIGPSKRAQEFRGRRVSSTTGVEYMWIPKVNGHEFSYEINTEHPLVAGFSRELTADQMALFERLLDDLQSTFPLVDAHNRLSTDGVPARPDDQGVVDRAVAAWRIAAAQGIDIGTFLAAIGRAEPYCLVPNLEERVRKAVA